MIANLQPYPEYKELALPWLGRLPSHWGLRRNGGLFLQRNETDFPDLPILEVAIKSGVKVRDLENGARKQVMTDRRKYKRALCGDIAYNMMRMWQGATGRVPVDGLVSPAYVVARPLSGTESRYFELLFRTPTYQSEVNNASRGIVSDRNRLYWPDFKQLFSPLPPPEEQSAIVRFLDYANGRLERAIRSKRKVIALLHEQKQAIIHRAVTRGIDPTVPLKPTGIPWLGDIPTHWEVMPVKRACSLIRDGTHLPPPRTATGFPLLSVRNIINGRLVRRPDDSLVSKENFDKLNASFVVRPNDVLMAIVGATLGKVAVVEDIGPFQIQRSVAIFRPRPAILAHDFFATFLRSPRLQQHLWQSVAFSAQPGIYLGFVANIPVPVPPTTVEQVSICERLKEEVSPVNTAINHLEREISLLREYRTRLVADVVTGKLDVRTAARHLPAESLVPEDAVPEEFTEPELEEIEA